MAVIVVNLTHHTWGHADSQRLNVDIYFYF